MSVWTTEEIQEARRRQEEREQARIEKRGEQLDALEGTKRILVEVEGERDRQNEKWGGPSHDAQHGPRDWAAFITEHLGKALDATRPQDYRRRMLQVAALAVAAIETADASTQPDPASEEGE